MCILGNSQRISSNTAFALSSLLSGTPNKQVGSLTELVFFTHFPPFFSPCFRLISPDLHFFPYVQCNILPLSCCFLRGHSRKAVPMAVSSLWTSFWIWSSNNWHIGHSLLRCFPLLCSEFYLASAGRLNGLAGHSQHRSSRRSFQQAHKQGPPFSRTERITHL